MTAFEAYIYSLFLLKRVTVALMVQECTHWGSFLNYYPNDVLNTFRRREHIYNNNNNK